MQSADGLSLQQLLSKLKNIEDAKLTQQVDTAYEEFIALLKEAIDQTKKNYREQRIKYGSSFEIINAAIDGTHLLDPTNTEIANKGVRDAIVQAKEHLKVLSEWEKEHVEQVPYINFSVLDMKGLQDWASGLVYSRVRERLDGFIGFLKREETYRYGLLNHLFLIPYIQAIR